MADEWLEMRNRTGSRSECRCAQWFPDNLTVVNGSLYFTAVNNFQYQGSQVWRSDGAKAGTVLLADTYPELRGGGVLGPPLPGNFTALDARTVLFTALDRKGGFEP
jgi:ELWxxDGT repeat protein